MIDRDHEGVRNKHAVVQKFQINVDNNKIIIIHIFLYFLRYVNTLLIFALYESEKLFNHIIFIYTIIRWTIRTTEWQVRKGRRSRGRPKMRWKDDIMKWKGATWTRTAKDRKKWKELTEGYFQQWRDTA